MNAKTKAATVARSATTRAPKTVAGVATSKRTKHDETAYLSSSPKNAARLQESIAQVKAATRSKAIQLDVPPGTVDIHQLVEMLAARLSPQTLLAQQSTGASVSAVNSPSAALTANPVDYELASLGSNLNELHSALGDLYGTLRPFLSHEEPVAESDTKTRPSESPLHRSLLDLNETLNLAIDRVRHLNGRVRN